MVVFRSVIVEGLKKKMWLIILVVPLVLGMIFSGLAPMMQYFRFLYLVPIVAILLVEAKFKKIMVVGFLIFSGMYLLNPKYHREDWKGLSQELGKKVYMIGTVADPVRYYRMDVEVADIRGMVGEREIEVIPYAEEIHGFNHGLELTKKGYQLIEQKSYRGLIKEKWQRKS
jgi:hypothetical protein